jgi:hypothetical protein
MISVSNNSRGLPVAAMLFSIPLFFTYPIKHVLFPEGLPFVIMYTWGLVAVVAVPILLVAEFVVSFRIFMSAPASSHAPLCLGMVPPYLLHPC